MTSNKEHGIPGPASSLAEQVVTLLDPAAPGHARLDAEPAPGREATLEELKRAYSDLENLLASSQIAALFLDRHLNIKRFTPAMAQVLKLCQADIGQPFRALTAGSDGSSFAAEACAVMETLVGLERELSFRETGRHYLMRLLPYNSAEGEGDGVVVTLVDLTERKLMEEALRQATDQWERTFDSVPDLIAILDDQHRIVRANRALTERLGLSAEPCEQKHCFELFHGSCRPPESCPHARTLRDGAEHVVELYAECLNGDFLVTTTPLHDEAGKLVGSVHVARDIADRKRAEEELRRRKEQVEQHLTQLQAILDHLNDGVVIADPQGNLFHWNPAALAMHDFADLRECQLNLSDFQETFELATPERGVIPAEQWPLARILRGEPVRDLVAKVRRLDVGWQRVFSYGGTLVRGKGGEPLLAVLSICDVTERHQVEETLRQSELQFRTLADAMPQLCWMANADGWITWYNRRWYDYTGTTAEQMEGWGWQSVHDPEVLPAALERWQQSLVTGRPFEMIFPLRGADGCFRQFLTRVLPVRDAQGNIVRWFGTNTDFTEQSRAEQALQRSNQRLNLMAETASELLVTESPQEVVNSICRKVMEFIGCEFFFNFLLDDQQQRLHLNACGGISEEEARQIEWLEFGTAICGCAVRDACRIVAEDIQNTQDPRATLARSYGIQAYACHPLVAQGRAFGTLSFGTSHRSSFTQDELVVMNGVADLVAIAIQRKQMEESLRRSEAMLRRAHNELEQRVQTRTEELAATVQTLQGEIAERERAEASLLRLNRLYVVLSEIDQAIVRASNRETLFRDFCRIAVEHGGFRLAWVGLLDEESGRVEVVSASGVTAYLNEVRITGRNEEAGGGPTGISIREGTYCISNDFQNDPGTRPWHDKGREHGIRSSASIALKEHGKVVGALTLYAGDRDFFDQQHVALLRQMGTDISFALENFLREARRREAEQALQQETLERLLAVESLREKERLLIQQSRQAALGEMIGNIAHQWRQPLNALGLMIQELPLCYEYGEFSKKYLDETTASVMQIVQHMSQTIDDFRNFFRPDKEKVDFRVRSVIDKAIAIVDASLKENGITLELTACADPQINGYPNEYSQVILNILLNARDAFLERGTRQPLIEVRLGEENGRSLVTIADNAGGIADQVMESIFDPYFTTKGPDKGTGVGLYMSKVITEKNMNGRLTARNGELGAEFRIEV